MEWTRMSVQRVRTSVEFSSAAVIDWGNGRWRWELYDHTDEIVVSGFASSSAEAQRRAEKAIEHLVAIYELGDMK